MMACPASLHGPGAGREGAPKPATSRIGSGTGISLPMPRRHKQPDLVIPIPHSGRTPEQRAFGAFSVSNLIAESAFVPNELPLATGESHSREFTIC
jgi:hypothetical protein